MKLIAVTNDRMSISNLVRIIMIIEPYMDAVILREKSKFSSEILYLIQRLKEENFDTKKVIVHGNPAIATAEQIQNVQLPGYRVSLPKIQKQYPNLSFGKSVHSFKEAHQAEADGAESVLYGHLFTTSSKAGIQPRGTEEISDIAASLQIPVYAIGGIQPQHIEQLKGLNIAGIAVMSSIFNSEDPKETAKSYYDAIHSKGGIFCDKND